jgi:hypothetical protein
VYTFSPDDIIVLRKAASLPEKSGRVKNKVFDGAFSGSWQFNYTFAA